MGNLKQKFIRGFTWNSTTSVISQISTVIVTLILARILNPEDFGLLAMVTVATGVLSFISEPGISSNVVRQTEVSGLFLNTAFWLGFAFSTVTFLLVIMLAAPIAYFYGDQRVQSIAVALSVVFLCTAYTHVPLALQIRSFEYKRIGLIRITAVITAAVTALVLAQAGAGVWALVSQVVLYSFLTMIGVMLFIPWHPKLEFSKPLMIDQLKFGKGVVANNILKFISESIDLLIVGKLLGATELGFYSLAVRLARYPINALKPLMGFILHSAVSSLQNEKGRLQRQILKGTLYIVILCTPLVVLLVLISDEIVIVLLGEKWLQASPILAIMAPIILLQAANFLDQSVVVVFDKLKLANLSLALTCIAIATLSPFFISELGIVGMALLYSICMGGYLLFLKWYALVSIGSGFSKLLFMSNPLMIIVALTVLCHLAAELFFERLDFEKFSIIYLIINFGPAILGSGIVLVMSKKKLSI